MAVRAATGYVDYEFTQPHGLGYGTRKTVHDHDNTMAVKLCTINVFTLHNDPNVPTVWLCHTNTTMYVTYYNILTPM